MNTQKFFNKLMAPRMTPFFIFLLAFIAFSLRNLDPIAYPSLYAEDGAWTADLLSHGFFDTAFNTRVFPILGFVIFYKTGLAITKVLFGGDISYLPLAYFVLSNIFMASLVACTYKIISQYLSFIATITIIIAILLLPVGIDSNEIYGRILNLGFIFPFFQAVLLCALFNRSVSKISLILILSFSIVSGLTFPIGLGISCIAMAGMFYSGLTSNDKKYFFSIALFLLFSVVISILTLSASSFTNQGGANLPFALDSFIEFSVARAILYPIVFYFYNQLNDTITISILLGIVVIVAIPLYKKVKTAPSSCNTITNIFLWLSFILYLGAMIIMRNGLTSVFQDYTSTFPDRYFTGLNLLFVTAFVFTLDQIRNKTILYLAFSLPFLITANKRFEFANPAMRFDAVAPWTINICDKIEQSDEEMALIDIPPKGWQAELPAHFTGQVDECLPFYNYKLLTELQPVVVVLPKVPKWVQSQQLLSYKVNNGILIHQANSIIEVQVTATDPGLILKFSSEDMPSDNRAYVSLDITSKIEGNLQLYYQTITSPSFSEQQSILIPILKGENQINLNFRQDVLIDNVRLDFPEYSGANYFIVSNENAMH